MLEGNEDLVLIIAKSTELERFSYLTSLNHSCYKASEAVGLISGSKAVIRLIKSIAKGFIRYQRLSSNLILPILFRSITAFSSSWVYPNGGVPSISMKHTIPALKRSILFVYGPSSISGAKYPTLPVFFSEISALSHDPKSAKTTLPSCARSMLSNLMSLCMKPLL